MMTLMVFDRDSRTILPQMRGILLFRNPLWGFRFLHLWTILTIVSEWFFHLSFLTAVCFYPPCRYFSPYVFSCCFQLASSSPCENDFDEVFSFFQLLFLDPLHSPLRSSWEIWGSQLKRWHQRRDEWESTWWTCPLFPETYSVYSFRSSKSFSPFAMVEGNVGPSTDERKEEWMKVVVNHFCTLPFHFLCWLPFRKEIVMMTRDVLPLSWFPLN